MTLTALVIDDDANKAEGVVAGISEVTGFGPVDIAADSISARRHLREKAYDLVVVDIALPLRIGEEPQPNGGLLLLQEVLSRAAYKRPRHFIGLTALREVYESAVAQFGNELWSVIFYERSSQTWLEQLQAKARHIVASESAQAKSAAYACDLCIVTALQDPELDAVLRLNWGWDKRVIGNDATTYYMGRFRRAPGEFHDVIAARASGMGMAASAVLAAKMISQFKPRCVIMCGICAGERSEVQLGDVIAAHPSWDYGSGKHALRNNVAIFEPAPQPLTLSTRLRGAVERLQSESQLLGDLRGKFAGATPSTALRVHIGPLASGSAVIANSALLTSVKTQNRKLLGIDMEGYGVMMAAAEALAPQPEVLVIKSVCDFADEQKDDRFRHYAAYTSAESLRLLAEKFHL
jgi:nucleoside phosphorylase